MRESEVAQSCPTLRDPMDRSLPGSSASGIFQAGVLDWGAMAFSGHINLVLPKWSEANRALQAFVPSSFHTVPKHSQSDHLLH